MRTITNFTNSKEIPPLSEREWNYSFEVGERVKIIPEMIKNHTDDPFSFYYIDKSLIDKIGIVISCHCDLQAFEGGSYVCKVDFEGEIISLMSMYFYTSLKFYK
jgi:hypothetical protein